MKGLGWCEVVFNPCVFGAVRRKGMRLLCSPVRVPALENRYRWVEETGRFSCRLVVGGGYWPHVSLSAGDAPTGPAAEYADGLLEAWAREIAKSAEHLKQSGSWEWDRN